jgi:hypothetical protein
MNKQIHCLYAGKATVNHQIQSAETIVKGIHSLDGTAFELQ